VSASNVFLNIWYFDRGESAIVLPVAG